MVKIEAAPIVSAIRNPVAALALTAALLGAPKTASAECPAPTPEATQTVDSLLAKPADPLAIATYERNRQQDDDQVEVLTQIEPDSAANYAHFLDTASKLLARRGLHLDTSRFDASLVASGYTPGQPNPIMTQFGKPAITTSVEGALLTNPHLVAASGANTVSIYAKWKERMDAAAYVFGDQPPNVVSINAMAQQSSSHVPHEITHLLFGKLCGVTEMTQATRRGPKITYELTENKLLGLLNPSPIYGVDPAKPGIDMQVASAMAWRLELKKIERQMQRARTKNNYSQYKQLLGKHAYVRRNVVVADHHGLSDAQEDAAEFMDNVLIDHEYGLRELSDPSLPIAAAKLRWIISSLISVSPLGVQEVLAVSQRPRPGGEHKPPTWRELRRRKGRN